MIGAAMHMPLSSLGSASGRTVIGTLLNFKGSLDRYGSQLRSAPYNAPPRAPVLYIRPESTWSTDGQGIAVPRDVQSVELGATLGLVIGRTASRVSARRALEYVAGYVIANDLCVPHENIFRPAIKERCRDGFCSIGPAVADRAAVDDPDALGIRAYVNGELCQQSSTRDLVRPVSRLLADVTEFMTLHVGDVLLVGVPDRAPRAGIGDRIAAEIDCVGRLENRLIADPHSPAELSS